MGTTTMSSASCGTAPVMMCNEDFYEGVTPERADDQGHLFGSVNAAAVVVLLKAAGHTVDETNVRLDAPLKVSTHVVLQRHQRGVTTRRDAEAVRQQRRQERDGRGEKRVARQPTPEPLHDVAL